MATYVVDAETAQDTIETFAEAMDLDVDVSEMDEDDRKAFADICKPIIRSIRRGHLVADEEGRPVFTPQVGKTAPIVFHEPNGASLMAMDKRKRGEDVAKGLAVLAATTREEPKRFANMAHRDLKVCNALVALFLG